MLPIIFVCNVVITYRFWIIFEYAIRLSVGVNIWYMRNVGISLCSKALRNQPPKKTYTRIYLNLLINMLLEKAYFVSRSCSIKVSKWKFNRTLDGWQSAKNFDVMPSSPYDPYLIPKTREKKKKEKNIEKLDEKKNTCGTCISMPETAESLSNWTTSRASFKPQEVCMAFGKSIYCRAIHIAAQYAQYALMEIFRLRSLNFHAIKKFTEFMHEDLVHLRRLYTF